MKIKKLLNLIIFISTVYTFQTFNMEMTKKFKDRLRMNEDKSNKRNREQLLSNYYCNQNDYPKDYYLEKHGFEIYKDFFYFIISLEQEDFIIYSEQADSYDLERSKNSKGFSFFMRLDIIFVLIFIMTILISFYFNKKYIYVG